MKKIEIYIDGASKGNPGYAGVGLVVCQNKEVVGNISRFIGKNTNNAAEYQALIFAMQEALLKGADELTIFSDSELLVKQINGEYKIKSGSLKAFYEQVSHLKKGFKFFEIIHIPRSQNRGADKLASLAVKNRNK